MDICFPLPRLRVPTPLAFPTYFRSLRFAVLHKLGFLKKRIGELCVSRCRIRFGGQLGFVGSLLFYRLPICRASDTSVASLSRALVFTRTLARRSLDHLWQVLREERPASLIRDAFHRQRSHLFDEWIELENGHVKIPLRINSSAFSPKRPPFGKES